MKYLYQLMALMTLISPATFATPTLDNKSLSNEQPNIILILADDLGYADLSIQGETQFKTPNIDSIATNGVHFQQGYVSNSVCAPSRAGLMSGRIGIGFEANLPHGRHGLDTKLETMADMLKRAGYGTSVIGKWHLGIDKKYYPTNRGFDYFAGLRGGSRSYFYNPKYDDKPGHVNSIEINGQQVKFDGYLTDYLTDKAIEVIDTHTQKTPEKPFFMYLSYTAPHGPMHGKPELIKKYEHIKNKRRRIYASMMDSLDEGVGRVLERLDTLKLTDNTIVVFLSDNGGPTMHNASNNGALKGNKGSLSEGGIRVPFMMQWPAAIPAGQSRNGMVSSLDLVPTFAAAAGVKPVEKASGINLMPYLSNKNKLVGKRTLHWRRDHMTDLTLRSGKFKWQENRKNKKTALYNLEQDLGEQEDLSKKYPEVVKQLKAEYHQWETTAPKPAFTSGWTAKDEAKKQAAIARKARRKAALAAKESLH